MFYIQPSFEPFPEKVREQPLQGKGAAPFNNQGNECRIVRPIRPDPFPRLGSALDHPHIGWDLSFYLALAHEEHSPSFSIIPAYGATSTDITRMSVGSQWAFIVSTLSLPT